MAPAVRLTKLDDRISIGVYQKITGTPYLERRRMRYADRRDAVFMWSLSNTDRESVRRTLQAFGKLTVTEWNEVA